MKRYRFHFLIFQLFSSFFFNLYSSQGDNRSIRGLEHLHVTRNEHLDPDWKGSKNKIAVFIVAIEEQTTGKFTGYRFNSSFPDRTCLHRVHNGVFLILQSMFDKSQGNGLNAKLIEKMGQPFLGILNFDAFVNPKLYSLICKDIGNNKDHVLNMIASKMVYFNSDWRYAPVAGTYDKSYIPTKTFDYIQSTIKKNIENKENFLGSFWSNDDYLIASLCYNSDYKELLEHIQSMQKQTDYQFGFITTKFGGIFGHAVGIVVNKKDEQLQFVCMDGANIGLSLFGIEYKICTDLLAEMIENPDVLKSAIIRYVCAIKSHKVAATEIKELGLNNHTLYTSCYNPKIAEIKKSGLRNHFLFNRRNGVLIFFLMIISGCLYYQSRLVGVASA